MNRTVFRCDRVLIGQRLQPALVVEEAGRIVDVVVGEAWSDPVVWAGADVVNAPTGAVLLPGNVDSHVHVNEPGRTDWEGFASATEAACRGGITTIVDMPLNSIPATVDIASLARKRAAATGKLHVDVGFWGGAVPENLGWLRSLWEAGVLGFKSFLVDSGVPEFRPLDHGQFHRAMAEIATFDGTMIVHAEDPDVIGSIPAWSSRRYTDFVSSRPEIAEVNAIRTVIEAAREHGTRTHILHLSGARSLDLIADAKAEGLRLSVETCPHYLVFDAATVPDGAAEFKCCPPIRDAGNQRQLWEALGAGIIDAVVSDHSPSTVEEKARGGGDLALAWGGVSSLEVTFPTMVDEAATRGFGIERVSAWMAAGPARIAGLDAKGTIEVGRDADLIWYQPGRSIAIDGSRLAHRNKLSAYTGRTISGSVSRCIVRGRTAFDGDRVSAPQGAQLRR